MGTRLVCCKSESSRFRHIVEELEDLDELLFRHGSSLLGSK